MHVSYDVVLSPPTSVPAECTYQMTSSCHHLLVFQPNARIRWRRPVTTHCVLYKLQRIFHSEFTAMTWPLQFSSWRIQCSCLTPWRRYFTSVSEFISHSNLSLHEAQCITILRRFHRHASSACELKRVMEVREEGWRPKKSRKGSSFAGAFQSVHFLPVSISKQNICSKTVKYTRYTHFGPTHNLVRTVCRRLHNAWAPNVLQPRVLSASSWATRTKIAVSGKPNSLNYCVLL
jgi:hypothetical protein